MYSSEAVAVQWAFFFFTAVACVVKAGGGALVSYFCYVCMLTCNRTPFPVVSLGVLPLFVHSLPFKFSANCSKNLITIEFYRRTNLNELYSNKTNRNTKY